MRGGYTALTAESTDTQDPLATKHTSSPAPLATELATSTTHLATKLASAPSYLLPGTVATQICPRITRTKLVFALLVVFLFTFYISFQCLMHRFGSLCCGGDARTVESASGVLRTASTSGDRNHVISDQSHDSLPSGRGFRRQWQRDRLHALAHDDVTEWELENGSDTGKPDVASETGAKLRRHFPQVIIIGVRKGGTRALLEFLNLHPSILAKKGEMHFFDDDEAYSRGLEWYRAQMPLTAPGQMTVEKTPAYFTEELVPARVHDMDSNVRLLLVLRDPTERAISDYTQILYNKREAGKPFPPFEELAVGPDGFVNKSYKAIRRSMYCRHMERWLRWFPLEQFHFVDGARLVSDPVHELAKVEEFLGLEHQLTKDRFYYNSTRGFYCMKLAHKEKCLAPSKGRTHPEVAPQVVHQLRQFFKPLNQKFYSLAQKEFHWTEE